MVSRRMPTPLGIGNFIEIWSIESIFRTQLLRQLPKEVRSGGVTSFSPRGPYTWEERLRIYRKAAVLEML